MGTPHRAVRTCLGCRQSGQREELVRYVVSPSGDLLVDYRGRLPGRGAYTCRKKACLEQAVVRRQFQRSLKQGDLQVDSEILQGELVRQIRLRIVNLLGICRKAGLVSSGSNLVLAGMDQGMRFQLLLLANDVSEGIGKKLRQRADRCGLKCWSLFDKAELGQPLGRIERSVIAIEPSALGKELQHELQCYEDIAGEI